MKKILSLSLVFILTALCLVGCNKTDATKNVIAMIDSIGVVTNESGVYLKQVEAAYGKLTEEEKKDVNNYSKYEKALAEYNEITDFNLQVIAMNEEAESDFSQSDVYVNYDELITSGRELLNKYDDMDDERKKSVTKEIDQLQSSIETFEGYRRKALSCAAAYCKAFLKVYEKNKYTITDIGCICDIREDDQYMFFALTARNDKKTANYYAGARFAKADVNLIVKNSQYFFCSEPAYENTDALTNRSFSFTVDEVMAEADNLPEPTTVTETTTAEETTTAAKKKNKKKTQETTTAAAEPTTKKGAK